MKIKVLIISALRNLRNNKNRSFLTMLGIIIGIAAVITIFALGDGYKRKAIKELTGNDTGNVLLQAYLEPDENSMENLSGGTFNSNDKRIIESLEAVEKVEYEYSNNAYGTFIEMDIRSKSFQGMANGVDSTEATNIVGRNLTKADSDLERRVMVVKEDIFVEKAGNVDELVGSIAIVNGISYEIVGIEKVDPENGMSLFSMDSNIKIPSGTYKKFLQEDKIIQGLKITLKKDVDMKKTIKEIENLLNSDGSAASKGKYKVMDTSGIIDFLGGVLNTLTVFIASVAGISLFIAGIGVMNMVYTSVSERTLEIGIKRALGAKKKDIKREFLIEGVVITLTGGLIGYILGMIIANIISAFMKFTIVPNLFTTSIAIGISVFVGVASSILPATKAANANTIDILK